MSYLECGFDKLSDLNDRRAGEQYHEVAAWSPMQWGCAMAGEAGELCNVLKKLERGRPEDLESFHELFLQAGEETADIIIYLDLTLKRLNQMMEEMYPGSQTHALYLRDCVRDKFNKTSEKIGSEVFW